MLKDFQKDKRLGNYDVCIAGGGPAGISLALTLGRKGLRIALLEGGGLAFDPNSQALYDVKTKGTDLYAQSSRLRYFGGTSNHWSGRCRPFVADDFRNPPQGGLPGWPIPFEDFNRFLPEAMRLVELPKEGFVAVNSDIPGGNFSADISAMSPPTRFGTRYLDELRASQTIDVIYNCNCVDLVFDKQKGEINHIKVVDFQAKKSNLTAKRYVLAMGAIENARILLNSTSLEQAKLPAMNWAGRCFMEHLNVALGTFIPANPETFTDSEYFPTEKMVHDYQVGRGNISLGVVKEVSSYGRTAAVKNFVKNLACNLGVADKIKFIEDFHCPGAGTIGTLLEQFPSAEGSRVSLSNERDAVGLRKAVVNWELSEHDKRTIRTLGKEIAKNFASAKLGFIKLADFVLDDSKPIPFAHHCHHMGTTRMADSAQWGVVDTNSKVFGVNNLYVAGASVFPTGGGGNPTMPLLQLTLRLGEHLLKT